jgi:hypothetical protein
MKYVQGLDRNIIYLDSNSLELPQDFFKHRTISTRQHLTSTAPAAITQVSLTHNGDTISFRHNEAIAAS